MSSIWEPFASEKLQSRAQRPQVKRGGALCSEHLRSAELTIPVLSSGEGRNPRKTLSSEVNLQVWLTFACCLGLADGGGQEVKEPRQMAAISGCWWPFFLSAEKMVTLCL